MGCAASRPIDRGPHVTGLFSSKVACTFEASDVGKSCDISQFGYNSSLNPSLSITDDLPSTSTTPHNHGSCQSSQHRSPFLHPARTAPSEATRRDTSPGQSTEQTSPEEPCTTQSASPAATEAHLKALRAALACMPEEEADGEPSEPELITAHDEAERIKTLLSLDVIDEPAQPRFDCITALMRTIFDTPVSALTLISDDTIHMHSRAGQWACSAPRRGSFCDWILDGQQPRMLVVENASRDARFARNRYVCGPPYLRFYAGCPLVGSTGHRYGTLCIIDFKPRSFEAQEYLALCHFAELAVRELERDALHEAACSEFQGQLQDAHLRTGRVLRAIDALEEAVVLTDVSHPEWPIVYANDAWAKITAADPSTSKLLCDSSAHLNPSTWAPFWHLFAGKVLDQREAGAAVAAVQKDRPFILSLRSSDQPDGILTLRFKPITEAGPLGDTCMPSIAIAAGLSKDMSGSFSGGSHHDARGAAGDANPEEVDGSEQQVVLAAALAALSGVSSLGSSSATRCMDPAAAAVAAMASRGARNEAPIYDGSCAARPAPAAAAAAKPVYYLGVVVRSEAPPRPNATNPSVRLSTVLNNALGGVASSPFSFGSDPEGTPSMAAGTTTRDELGGSGAIASPRSLGVGSDAALIAERRARRASAGVVPMVPLSVGTYGPGVPSLAPPAPGLAVRDEPPSALGDLTLGPMLGQGHMCRSYRGTWMGTRVAVKVSQFVEAWEHNNENLSDAVPPRSHQNSSISRLAHPAVLPVYADHEVCTRVAVGGEQLQHPLDLASAAAAAAAAGSSGDDVNNTATPWQGSEICHVLRQVWQIRKFADRGNLTDAINCGMLRNVDGLDVPAILLTARDVAAGVAFLHNAGCLHGSLSSANVLLLSDAADEARGWTAVVSDPWAMLESEDEKGNAAPLALTLPPSAQVTNAAHLSAEILLGGKLTRHADVWSFGVLLWEMVHGRQAWRGMTPSQVLQFVALEGCSLPAPGPDCPPALATLMSSCMHADPNERPPFSTICNQLNVILSTMNLDE